MFKNLIAFRIGADWAIPDLDALQEVLTRREFEPCAATQEESVGWAAPRREEHAPMMENVGGELILKLVVERKTVPSSAVKAELERRCKQLEQERGVAPRRREKKAMKEEVERDLLPRAFSKTGSCLVWIDRTNRLLVVGTASYSMADLVVDQLVEAMAAAGASFPLAPIQTVMSPSAAMSEWLVTREAPAEFTVDRDLELRQPDNERSVVRYSRHNLERDEIVQHITEGKVPAQLAMTFNSRVSFTLASNLSLKKIELLDDVFEKSEEGAGFDGDVALATGELSKLIPALFEALGGEVQPDTPAEHADAGEGSDAALGDEA